MGPVRSRTQVPLHTQADTNQIKKTKIYISISICGKLILQTYALKNDQKKMLQGFKVVTTIQNVIYTFFKVSGIIFGASSVVNTAVLIIVQSVQQGTVSGNTEPINLSPTCQFNLPHLRFPLVVHLIPAASHLPSTTPSCMIPIRPLTLSNLPSTKTRDHITVFFPPSALHTVYILHQKKIKGTLIDNTSLFIQHLDNSCCCNKAFYRTVNITSFFS